MIAITGAAGFIGSHVAHRLSKLGHELLLVDHPLVVAKTGNFVGLDRFQFLDHTQFLIEIQKSSLKLDGIFHLGACSKTTETNWDYLLANNVNYTQTLWNWCATHQQPFIYASSAATYGNGSKGFDDHTLPTELEPMNLYGKSKNDFDIWVLDQVSRKQPLPPTWAGMKFFNVYGPRERHKGSMASVIWHSFRQIRDAGVVKLFRSTDPAYSDGGQLRDFVFVEDCVDHMLWFFQERRASGIFNSGTGQARTFLDLAKATFAALGKEPKIEFIDMPEGLKKQYQNYTQATLKKLRHAGYQKAPTTLEAGAKLTVEGYLALMGG